MSERVSPKALLKLLEQQGRKCALSGVDLTPETIALDHKKPLNAGGSNTMDNVQLVHRVINQMKGTVSHDDYVAWSIKVALQSGAVRCDKRQQA